MEATKIKNIDWSEICKGCGECCGPVPFTPGKFAELEHHAQASYEIILFIGGTIIPETKDMYCVFLDRLIRRCVIYDNRLEVCRLQGTIPRLPCPKLQKAKTLKLADGD